MREVVLDASIALQWLLEDESGREYSLKVLDGLTDNQGVVPLLWFYEVGNGLIMAYRRKRISFDQVSGFITRLHALPIEPDHQTPTEILELPSLAHKYQLTNYDAAYLALALKLRAPLATTDDDLRRAANVAGVEIAKD